jgi:hypothetical protein
MPGTQVALVSILDPWWSKPQGQFMSFTKSSNLRKTEALHPNTYRIVHRHGVPLAHLSMCYPIMLPSKHGSEWS